MAHNYVMYRRPLDPPSGTDAPSSHPDAVWAARSAELFEKIAEEEREIARRQGEQVVSMAAPMWEAGLYAGEDETAFENVERSVRADLALKLRGSEDFTAARLEEASQLATRLPKTLAALRAGEITLYKAGVVRAQTVNLTVEQCHRLERGVVAKAGNLTPDALRRATRRAVVRMDRDAARKRAKAARRERGVGIWEGEDGLYSFHATLAAEDAIALFGVVDTLAHATKKALAPGDDRRIGELRADALLDLILRPNGEQRVAYDVRVVMPIGTVLGVNDQDGYLPGHGPIPAALCRELAADNTWRRILTDPCTGHLLDLGASRYAPPDRLMEFVRTRDQHCRFPGCRRTIDHSEVDHTVEFAIGGLTIRINVSVLCRRHHRVKHLPGWDLIQDPDGSGTLTFLTPSGQMFRTRPPDLVTGEDADVDDLTPARYPDVPPF
jgi:hypothetical protein